MSTLRADTLMSSAMNNWSIDLAANSYIFQPGRVLQTQWRRSNVQTTYAGAASGNGTTISELAISITPRSASSLLICSWMIVHEINTNSVFVMHRDGALITTSGYEGYNSVTGNLRYSGVAGAMYDNNDSSTPSHVYIQYAVPATVTTSTTIAPAIRASGATAVTLYLNRSVANAGADDVEIGVSMGVIWEIAQA